MAGLTQNAPVACKKNVSNNFIRDYLPWRNKYFLVIFASIALKLEKFGPVFSSFNPLCILAIRIKRRQETDSVAKDVHVLTRTLVLLGVTCLNKGFDLI